jgi:hypothetical protein
MKRAVLSDYRVAYMLSPLTQREIQPFHYCQANIKQETTITTLQVSLLLQKHTTYILVYLHVPIQDGAVNKLVLLS